MTGLLTCVDCDATKLYARGRCNKPATAVAPTAGDFLAQAAERLDALACQPLTPAEHELWRIAAHLAAALRLATTPDPQRPADRAPCPACNDTTETTETGA